MAVPCAPGTRRSQPSKRRHSYPGPAICTRNSRRGGVGSTETTRGRSMRTTFDVHAENGAAQTGAVASVVASLPMSLAPGQADTAALQGVSGTNGWAERAAETIIKGAAGVAVIAPEPADTQSLER